MRKLISLFFILLAPIGLYADILYLNSGEKIAGNIQLIDDKALTIKLLDNQIKVFNNFDIANVLFSQIRQNEGIGTLQQMPDPFLKELIANAPTQTEFADTNYLTLFNHSVFEINQTSEITCTTRRIVKIMSPNGLSEAKKELFYWSDRETPEILFARSISPSGDVCHITDEQLTHELLYSDRPDYAKLSKLSFTLQNVFVNSVLDYSFKTTIKKTDEIHPIRISKVFVEKEPVILDKLQVIFPQNMNIQKEMFQWQGNKLPLFSEKIDDKNQQITWNWSYTNLQSFVSEPNMLPLARIFPRVLVYQKNDWEQTVQKLSWHYQPTNLQQKAIQHIINEANIGTDLNDYSKTLAIYSTINRMINTIDLSPLDLGSFEPTPAEITLANQYGNQQAKQLLLYLALKKLNITSYPGFADERVSNIDPELYPNLSFVPNPVTKIVFDNNSYYVDFSSPQLPFGAFSVTLQGSKAIFFDPQAQTYFFETLPKQTHDWNRLDRTVNVHLDLQGNMSVTETILYRGPFEKKIRTLKKLPCAEQRKYVQNMLTSIHPAATLISFAFSDISDINVPALLTLNYFIPDAAQKASNDIMTFAIFWLNYSSSSASLKKRNFPMQYWATEESQQTITFNLPEGFTWTPWEHPYRHFSNNLTYLSGITQNNNLLIFSDRFVVKNNEFCTDEEYADYRKCLITMSELASQWIIIERSQED